jgi:predicted transcriptional regulator
VLAKYETNSVMAGHMADARRKLANVLDSDKSLRSLRLGAGMSQSQLAERSHTTQSYIARVEAGKVDPGTDMISQLASALSVAEDVVFSAVRARRSQRDAVHVR